MARRETLNRPWRARVLVSKDRPVGLLARASTRASVSATGRCAPLGGFRNACGEQLRGSAATTPRAADLSLFVSVGPICALAIVTGISGRAAQVGAASYAPASQATLPG